MNEVDFIRENSDKRSSKRSVLRSFVRWNKFFSSIFFWNPKILNTLLLFRTLPRPLGKASWSELSHSLKVITQIITIFLFPLFWHEWWSEICFFIQLGLAILPPTVIGLAIPLIRRQPIKHFIPSMIAAVGHVHTFRELCSSINIQTWVSFWCVNVFSLLDWWV